MSWLALLYYLLQNRWLYACYSLEYQYVFEQSEMLTGHSGPHLTPYHFSNSKANAGYEHILLKGPFWEERPSWICPLPIFNRDQLTTAVSDFRSLTHRQCPTSIVVKSHFLFSPTIHCCPQWHSLLHVFFFSNSQGPSASPIAADSKPICLS